jgi:hypothetical protein
METLVVTSCTGRKRAEAPPTLRKLPSRKAIEQHGGGLAGLAGAWMAEVGRASERFPVTDLYAGRTIVDAMATSRTLGARLYVASAGLGLLDERDRVPGYSLTVAQGSESVLPALERLSSSVAQWWSVLNLVRHGHSHPLSALIKSRRPARVLLALPARYLEMVATDLAQLPASRRENIFVFTSPAGLEALPPDWHTQVLPYDERLDGEGSPRPGTRTDFAQRAMRHFVEDLQATGLPLAQARQAVLNALSSLKHRTLPQRRRADDDEVLHLLRTHWDAHKGQSSRLLRFLRDDALVSCEQSRFRALWLQLRAEMVAAPAEETA